MEAYDWLDFSEKRYCMLKDVYVVKIVGYKWANIWSYGSAAEI